MHDILPTVQGLNLASINPQPTIQISPNEYEALVEESMRELDAKYEAVKKAMEQEVHLALMSMSKELRESKPFAKQKPAEKKDSLGSNVAAAVDEAMAHMKAVSRTKTATKKALRSTRKQQNQLQTPSVVVSAALEPPSTGLRRSTRKRTATALAAETPAFASRRGRAALPTSTPMITPKFDLSTPMARSAFRAPKQDETLVSLSGSPVDPQLLLSTTKAAITTAKRAPRAPKGVDTSVSVPIKLAKGKTILVPMEEAKEAQSGQFDFGKDELEKLELVKSNIESLLKHARGE